MPPSDIASTGQAYYSHDWTAIRDLAKTLNIGEGKLASVTKELVNRYQEMIDRTIDGMLTNLYYVPLRSFNQVQPDGTKKLIFPGEVAELAKYWTAGALILTEFQGMEPNITEQATSYVEESRKKLYKLMRPSIRIQGQEQKSNISKTMPPSMQPMAIPEADF